MTFSDGIARLDREAAQARARQAEESAALASTLSAKMAAFRQATEEAIAHLRAHGAPSDIVIQDEAYPSKIIRRADGWMLRDGVLLFSDGSYAAYMHGGVHRRGPAAYTESRPVTDKRKKARRFGLAWGTSVALVKFERKTVVPYQFRKQEGLEDPVIRIIGDPDWYMDGVEWLVKRIHEHLSKLQNWE